MEKDNKNCEKKCAIKSGLCKIISKAKTIIDRFIEDMDSLDPSHNTRQRILSSLVLLPVAIYAIFISKNLFLLMIIAIAILMTIEWLDMIKNLDNSQDEKRWRVIGFFYILIPLYSVYKLRFIDSNIVFWMFSIIWVTDIFAFFAGRIIGGKKLAPSISPNKTWSGLFGGVAASAAIGFVSAFMFNGTVIFFIIISILLSLIEQVGDLLESKFKRIFGVKDSGSIIPGHGGILDRLDGMMLLAPFVLFVVTVFSHQFGL